MSVKFISFIYWRDEILAFTEEGKIYCFDPSRLTWRFISEGPVAS